MAPAFGRNKYSDAIEKVRLQHADTISPANLTVECPKCGMKQVIQDAPGMRKCMKCGYEFRPRG
jgi:ribosomal protein L37AE/L43A